MTWPISIIPMLSWVVAVTIQSQLNLFMKVDDLLKIKWPNDSLQGL